MVESGELMIGHIKLLLTWPQTADSKPSKPQEEPVDPYSILVENVTPELRESLELKLEREQSGGGEIESFVPNEDQSVMVKFIDQEGMSSYVTLQFSCIYIYRFMNRSLRHSCCL